jgi:hypothetical protein
MKRRCVLGCDEIEREKGVHSDTGARLHPNDIADARS